MNRLRRLAIVKAGEFKISETFIRAHIERLPCEVVVIDKLPPWVAGVPVRSQSLAARSIRFLKRRLGRESDRQRLTALYVPALRQAKVEAVLAEYGPTAARVVDACAQLELPLIAHFHGYDATEREVLAQYQDGYQRVFRHAAAVIAVSRAMEAQLRSLGVPREKLHYCPYGVDCAQFTAANPAAAPPVLLAVGNFVEKKAPHLTLVAFARVLERRPESRLRMLGGGALLPVCRDLAKALQLEHAVTFLGAQDHTQVRWEMQQARAFVQHSVQASTGDSEGTPVAIIEAGASGLPVVSTRHAGIPDVVVEGQTGFLVDERDVAGMAQHMIRLVESPALAQQMGVAARHRIEAEFSMERSINQLWSILNASARPTS
jgi:glycosyltransferase involved in cell wall biosynthesis